MKQLKTILLALASVISLAGCNGGETTAARNTFGDFSYNNIFLKEYATTQIGVEEAKKLVDINYFKTSKNTKNTEEGVIAVLTKYASTIATVKYYVSDREEQQVRVDIYQGTDFKFLLETNHYEPFGQMSVRYLFVDDNLLDDMERQNEEFISSSQHIVSPFNEPYTYHKNDNDMLIVQTHNFAELPASVSGGIGSTFRQDCELVFDEEGKITFWQSSLGLYTSTPTGTVKQGYIFEVAFEWIAK